MRPGAETKVERLRLLNTTIATEVQVCINDLGKGNFWNVSIILWDC